MKYNKSTSKEKSYKMIQVYVTSSQGTGLGGKYKAKTAAEAIKKAKLKFGDEAKYWTFYV